MLTWTIKNCIVCHKLLEHVLKEGLSFESIEKNRELVSSIKQMSPELRNLYISGIDFCKKNMHSDISVTFISEMLASIDYAQKNAKSGKLNMIARGCILNKNAQPAIDYLNEWLHNAQKNQLWASKSAWFDMRVMCMDVFCLIHIFSCNCKMCIFYGGDSHAQTLCSVISKYGSKTTCPEILYNIAKNQNLLSITTYVLYDSKTVVIIGENHNMTKQSFANNLLNFLKSKCNKEKINVLIEKHITNKQDFIQTELMCNIPHMAIHKFRCDSFTETNLCANLHIVAVDNRHYDMGFIRTEIMDIWSSNLDFRRNAIIYNKKCLKCLSRIAKKLQALVNGKLVIKLSPLFS